MKSYAKTLTLAGALILAAAQALPAAAYTRVEALRQSGGTKITVYDGTINSNSEDPYLEKPDNYLAAVSYTTEKEVTSESNITSSTNFHEKEDGAREIVHGGVNGISFDRDKNTLTLDNASGTVITIEGTDLDVRTLNTYNDKLETLIDPDMPGLTWYKQEDIMGFSGDPSPHTKEDLDEGETITVKLIGDSSFESIVLSGNVHVIFTGSGTLTLSGEKTWDYNDYSDPDFDVLSAATGYALVSERTAGKEGILAGTDSIHSEMPNGMQRDLTENWIYSLPEISLSEGMKIEGGSINSGALADPYYVFSGDLYDTEVSALPEDTLDDTVMVSGRPVSVKRTADRSSFYVTKEEGMGPDKKIKIYDITSGIKSYQAYGTYIGDSGSPAKTVVFRGSNFN